MPRSRALLIAAAVAALAIGSLGAPAAAVDPGHIALVNGIPGKVVDVCFNGQEAKSNLRYGRSFAKVLPVGPLTIKVRVATAGTCKGKVLGTTAGTVDPGDDLSFVATAKGPPKVLFFDNFSLGTIDTAVTDQAAVVWRHAADLGAILWVIQEGVPITPAALPPLWEKGDSAGGVSTSLPYISFIHWVTKPGRSRPLAGPVNQNLGPNRRYEFYLVGTTPANARIVTLVRKILPAP